MVTRGSCSGAARLPSSKLDGIVVQRLDDKASDQGAVKLSYRLRRLNVQVIPALPRSRFYRAVGGHGSQIHSESHTQKRGVEFLKFIKLNFLMNLCYKVSSKAI